MTEAEKVQGVGVVYLECGFLASEKHKVGSRCSNKCGDVHSPSLSCVCSVPWRGQRILGFRLVEESVA